MCWSRGFPRQILLLPPTPHLPPVSWTFSHAPCSAHLRTKGSGLILCQIGVRKRGMTWAASIVCTSFLSRVHAALASEVFCPHLTPHVCYLVLPHLLTFDLPLATLLDSLSDLLSTGGLPPSIELLYMLTQLVNPRLGEGYMNECVLMILLLSPPSASPLPLPSPSLSLSPPALSFSPPSFLLLLQVPCPRLPSHST